MMPSSGDGAAPGGGDGRWAVAGLAAAGVALVAGPADSKACVAMNEAFWWRTARL